MRYFISFCFRFSNGSAYLLGDIQHLHVAKAFSSIRIISSDIFNSLVFPLFSNAPGNICNLLSHHTVEGML